MTDTTIADITALEDRRWAAQIAADTEALGDLLDDELSYTHSNTLVDTKASYIQAIADKVFDYRAERRSEVSTVIAGDAAMVTGRAEFDVVAGGRELSLSARYSAIWVRRTDGWRFLCWQSTPVPG